MLRSAMATELIAFGEMFYVANTFVKNIQHLVSNDHVLLRLETDNKALFDVTSKGSRTSEK